jgi:hypothetical protein
MSCLSLLRVIFHVSGLLIIVTFTLSSYTSMLSTIISLIMYSSSTSSFSVPLSWTSLSFSVESTF